MSTSHFIAVYSVPKHSCCIYREDHLCHDNGGGWFYHFFQEKSGKNQKAYAELNVDTTSSFIMQSILLCQAG
jgi:hypothetical protein